MYAAKPYSLQLSSTIVPTTAQILEMVFTKIASSEVMFTKPLSCADVCNKNVFSTVTVSSTVVLTTLQASEMISTKTVSSTIVPTKLVQATDVIATKTVPATSVTPTKQEQLAHGKQKVKSKELTLNMFYVFGL